MSVIKIPVKVSGTNYLVDSADMPIADLHLARINERDFIVHACNSHEALVALAEYALSRDMVGGFVIPNEIAFRAREALAKS